MDVDEEERICSSSCMRVIIRASSFCRAWSLPNPGRAISFLLILFDVIIIVVSRPPLANSNMPGSKGSNQRQK